MDPNDFHSRVYFFGYSKHNQLGHHLESSDLNPPPSNLNPTPIPCTRDPLLPLISPILPTPMLDPTPVLELDNCKITKVFCCGSFCAAINVFGEIYTWGIGKSSIPQKETYLKGMQLSKIAGSSLHTIALTNFGTVYIWEAGQILHPESAIFGPGMDSPGRQKEYFIDIHCGSLHTLFLTKSGRVYAMGINRFGQLGLHSTHCADCPTLVLPFDGKEEFIIQISAYASHSVALTDSGMVYTWGDNEYGQLGSGISGKGTHRFKPLQLNLDHMGNEPAKYVICGECHVLVLMEDNSLFGFGKNQAGQLGCGYFSRNEEIPKQVKVPHKEKIIMLKTGGGFGNAHSLFLDSSGKLFSFGSGSHGQLGHGSRYHCPVPNLVEFFSDKYIFDFACGWIHSLVVTQLDKNPDREDLGNFTEDVLWLILFHLDFHDVLVLSRCSFSFNNFTKHNELWKYFFRKEFSYSEGQTSALTQYYSKVSWQDIFSGYYIESNRSASILYNRFYTVVNKDQQNSPSPNSGIFSEWITPVFQVANDWWWKKTNAPIVINGLPGSGKTSIMKRIKNVSPKYTYNSYPKFGKLFEYLNLENMRLECWNLYHDTENTPNWVSLLQHSVAMIWVMDSANTEKKLIEDLEELLQYVKIDEFSQKPILIFANKQDHPRSVTALQIAQMVGLRPSMDYIPHTEEMWTQKWCIQPCSAHNGDGISAGLNWLESVLKGV